MTYQTTDLTGRSRSSPGATPGSGPRSPRASGAFFGVLVIAGGCAGWRTRRGLYERRARRCASGGRIQARRL